MVKEEPSVCGTQCTAHLGQGEKAKTKKKSNKKEYSFAKLGKNVSLNPDTVD